LLQQLQRILFLTWRKPRISSLRFASNQFKSRPGIKALVHQVKAKHLISPMWFYIAPRINAAGRKHGNHAVELLTEFNFEQAQQFASEIEQYNSDRKDLDKQITKEAFLQIEENKEQDGSPLSYFKRTGTRGYWDCRIEINRNLLPPNTSVQKSGDKYAASALRQRI
jgi:single-stranded-DNA-specific exonuclease